MSKILCDPTPNFNPCNINNIHLYRIKRENEGRLVCVSLSERLENKKVQLVSIGVSILLKISTENVSVSICIETLILLTTLHYTFLKDYNLKMYYIYNQPMKVDRSDCFTRHYPGCATEKQCRKLTFSLHRQKNAHAVLLTDLDRILLELVLNIICFSVITFIENISSFFLIIGRAELLYIYQHTGVFKTGGKEATRSFRHADSKNPCFICAVVVKIEVQYISLMKVEENSLTLSCRRDGCTVYYRSCMLIKPALHPGLLEFVCPHLLGHFSRS